MVHASKGLSYACKVVKRFARNYEEKPLESMKFMIWSLW